MFETTRNKPQVVALTALYVSTFFSGAWAMIIPTVPVLAQAFGVSAGGAAQVITAFAFGKMAGTVIGGVLLDRKGPRFSIIGSALVTALVAFGAVFSPWFWLLLAIAFVLGASDTLGAAAREIAAIDQVPSQQRGRLISSLHGTHSIGMALYPLLGGLLTELFDYRAAFFGYGVVSAISVFLGMMVADSPGEARERTAAHGAANGWSWAGLQRRIDGFVQLYRQIQPKFRSTYCLVVFATMVNQSQRIIVQSMLPLYAVRYLQLSPSQVGTLFTISGAVVFTVMIPAGFLMDRVGRKWCTVPSTGIPALTFLLMPYTTNFLQLALLVGIAGVAQGLSLGSLATATYDVVPPQARGRLQALRRTVAELGSGMAPLIAGYLANTFNPGVPFLAYAPLLLLSASLLLFVAKETLEK
jgi:MFS family permease